ncbi:hypothetical protein KUTeg_019858 [Tegillarca granosa]|uniref:Uncharacterized protein n=1 Tax=Tegillarca granosa TaxID=220873 RepID=A0ABQ9EIS8_TEGGR|nr:hypothetical protein KUTeg_019858 [Tegillarca granosa]
MYMYIKGGMLKWNKSVLRINFYQQQKLLSIGLDAPLPIGNGRRFDDLDVPVLGIKEKPGFPDDPQLKGSKLISDVDSASVFPVVAFVGTGLVLLFLLNQYYKSKSKPKRKRPRIKKPHHIFLESPQGYRGSGDLNLNVGYLIINIWKVPEKIIN